MIKATEKEEVAAMKYVGYHRVSTKQQNPERGIYRIQEFCKERNIPLYKDKVYVDQQTGKTFDRKWYTLLKEEILEPGDALIVSEVDRLGRDMRGTKEEIRWFQDHNIRLMILEIPTTLTDYTDMDNSIAKISIGLVNNLLLELFTYLAQSEMEKREQRQKEGIEAKRRSGTWEEYGRPRKVDFSEFVQLYESGTSNPEIVKKLGISYTTCLRYKKEYATKYGRRIEASDLILRKEKKTREYQAFISLFDDGKRPVDIRNELGISPASYYEYKKRYLQEKGGSQDNANTINV